QHIVERAEDRPVSEVLGKLVAEDRADGLILLTFLPLKPEDVAPLDHARVPYVLVNRHFGKQPVNCVTFEWEEAARDAAVRLGRQGHTRMALLLPDLENTSVVGRAKGWLAGVKQLGLTEDDAPILRYHGRPGVPEEMLAGGRSLATQLLSEGLPAAGGSPASASGRTRPRSAGAGRIPTAIVGFNDWCALGVLRVAAELNVQVPDQLSVIGFDSTRVADGTTPPLCSYSPRFIDLGRQAAHLLSAALQRQVTTPKRIEIPVDFICRGSCAPAPQTR
ncbi:MAG TPA: LacI family DNA-binding transcriptional regulator, partial [Chloroflexota bacterium]|nr:LacI family DNA-binding transcriptional regulator [Chloroflexota bacterium]